MATYPSGNPGVWPLDATTDIGRLRAIVNDTSSEPYDPPEPGFENYTLFSDAELQAFLDLGGDSLLMAAGYAYLALSAEASRFSKSVKDYDLAIDYTKRAADLRATAQFYFGQAGDVDGTVDSFDVVPTGCRHHWDELAERPVWWY